MSAVVLVAVGGAVGAPARFLVDRWVQSAHRWRFPLGTFAVNMTGCLLLGLLAGAALPAPWFALVGTGFCGAYTTYSTFGFEAVALAEQRAVRMSVAYVAASVLGGLLLAAGGYALTH